MKAGLLGATGLSITGFAACATTQPRAIANVPIETRFSHLKHGHIRKGYLDGPFGQVHFYHVGTGPCLILSHQSPTCARMFEKALPLLANKGLQVIAFDTPGFGNSDVPLAPPDVADYANVVPAILDGLGLSKAHFLGHHTGAGILGNFAARRPESVESLILNGPPLFTADDLEKFKEIKPQPHPIFSDGSHLQAAWDRRAQFSPGWTDTKAMHRRLVEQLWAGDTSWYGHHAAFKYDMKPDLLALSSRTMILTNTGDDAYDLSLNAFALRPDFEFFELPGGTHDIVDEQPEAWSDAVARFVLNT